jgi:hypothetical protein
MRTLVIALLLATETAVFCAIVALSVSLSDGVFRMSAGASWHRYIALVARVAPMPVLAIRSLHHVRHTALASTAPAAKS